MDEALPYGKVIRPLGALKALGGRGWVLAGSGRPAVARGRPAAGKSAVNRRVQLLHAPVADFGRAGVLAHIDDLDARRAQAACGAAGRQNGDTKVGQATREVLNSSFVADADQRSFDPPAHGSSSYS